MQLGPREPSMPPPTRVPKRAQSEAVEAAAPAPTVEELAQMARDLADAEAKRARMADDVRSEASQSSAAVSDKERLDLQNILSETENPQLAILKVAQLFGMELNPKLSVPEETSIPSTTATPLGEDRSSGRVKSLVQGKYSEPSRAAFGR